MDGWKRVDTTKKMTFEEGNKTNEKASVVPGPETSSTSYFVYPYSSSVSSLLFFFN